MADDQKGGKPIDPAAPASKDKLPGNHGQFGANDATEAYKPLEDEPTPADTPAAIADDAAEKADKGPKQTNAGERS